MFLRLREVPLASGESFCVRRVSDASFTCPYHFHLEIEIVLVEKGFATLMVCNEPQWIRAGDVFVLGCNTPHLTHNRAGESQGPDWAQTVLVQFLPDCFGNEFIGAPELIGVRRFLDTIQGGGVRVLGELRARIARVMKQLPELSGLDRVMGLLEMLRWLSQSAAEQLLPLTDNPHLEKMHQQDIDRLTRVFRYVQDRFDKDPSLAEVAKVAGMAPASFSRFFRQKTGRTFQNHLIDVRLNEACARLIRTEDTVIEICFGCGFKNLSNFNRLFRKHRLMTPMTFRKSWRDQGSGLI